MTYQEYANKFHSEMTNKEFKETLIQTIIDFFSEVESIMNETGLDLLSVMQQQDIKWQEFAKRVSGVSPYGFRDFISNKIRDIAIALNWR